MKTMNLLSFFDRRSIFAVAISITATFAFVTSASANEKEFAALRGVTVEALSPSAMDAIQGTGSIHVHYDFAAVGVPLPHGNVRGLAAPDSPRTIKAPWDIVINLVIHGPEKVTRIRAD